MDPSMREPSRDEQSRPPHVREDLPLDPQGPVVLLEPQTGQELILDEAAAWEHLISSDRPVIVVSGTLTRKRWLTLFAEAELRLHACIESGLARSESGLASSESRREGQVDGWRPPSVDAARERLSAVARVGRFRTDLRQIPGL